MAQAITEQMVRDRPWAHLVKAEDDHFGDYEAWRKWFRAHYESRMPEVFDSIVDSVESGQLAYVYAAMCDLADRRAPVK